MRVLYERWSEQPAAVLAGIYTTITKASFRNGFSEQHEIELHKHHSVAGNPARFSSGRITIAKDERWRRSMPLAQQTLVMAITLPLYSHYYRGQRTLPGNARQVRGSAYLYMD